MAQSYTYEDDEYFGSEAPFHDDNLVGVLDNTVQLSINKALAKALGPLTHHFESFARQKGWLPHIAPSDEALSDQPSIPRARLKPKPGPTPTFSRNWRPPFKRSTDIAPLKRKTLTVQIQTSRPLNLLPTRILRRPSGTDQAQASTRSWSLLKPRLPKHHVS
ncbi:hypothetical protein NDU88_002565 [Pleurodeles waltl]|uniref:Uncharacterized protein n=1 Tax=Pleurodeles waltl TaxID=8319 RepID=A0AAV7M0Y8_PLEWA|nr:hypothetical protein NDU88_002565 [Pleurodeles waltl]